MSKTLNTIKLSCSVAAAVLLAGCSSAGLGLANHPGDCALGIAWADCLPGTAGYNNGGGQMHREAAQQQKQAQADALAAPFKVARDQCIADMQSESLNPIRNKVELIRLDPNAGPAFEIAANDTFPTEDERPTIAAWGRLRDNCTQRMSNLSMLPPSATPLQIATAKKDKSFETEANVQIGRLIVALYQMKLTYGEFAHKRYEISRDASVAQNNFRQATLLADSDRQMQAQQLAQDKFRNDLAAWTAYNQSVSARQPQTVRIIDGGSVGTNCTSIKNGNVVMTNCN